MKVIKHIPRGMEGIRQTCRELIALAEMGQQNQTLRRITRILPPRATDNFLRTVWNYKPDGPVEQLTTIDRLCADYQQTSHFTGDCDEAATVAAAMLLLDRPSVKGATVVGVREPNSTWNENAHVFVVGIDHHGIFRIDPTAPADADYQFWEPLTIRIF